MGIPTKYLNIKGSIMNKKQKLVARKHRRNQERLKGLRLASIAVGQKKESKASPKKEAKVPAKAAAKTKKAPAKKSSGKKTSRKESSNKGKKDNSQKSHN